MGKITMYCDSSGSQSAIVFRIFGLVTHQKYCFPKFPFSRFSRRWLQGNAGILRFKNISLKP